MDIDALWDYNEPQESEDRFRSALGSEADPAIIDQIKTQIARTYSLRRRFADAHAILDEVAAGEQMGDPQVKVRYLLERGRTLNSEQDMAKAMPLFLEAFEVAISADLEVLAADAAHMVAIVAEGEEAVRWNLKTIELAENARDPKVKKWVAGARNNLGWAYHRLGLYPEALSQFEAALEDRRGGSTDLFMIAQWCVARALRSLGRLEEALSQQKSLEETRDQMGKPSGFVYEELGECLLALGRAESAKPYFERAYELLSADPWLAADEPDRLERLRLLSIGSDGDRAGTSEPM